MNARTSLFLVLLLGIVAVFLFRQDDESTAMEDGAPTMLFEGLHAPGLRRLDLENTTRGLKVTLERKDDGWWITDPVLHPADTGVIGLFQQMIQFNQLLPLTQQDPDPAALGFEPPQAIVHLETEGPDGEVATQTVELGAADLDDFHVYVRVNGELGRTVRNILNTMERNLDEFRMSRAIRLDAGQIVEVHRTGYEQASLASPRVDLELSAFRDGPRWVATAPLDAALDPLMMEALCGATTFLPITRHIVDVPEDPSYFGLDQPWWRIALRTYSGKEHALLFGRSSIEDGRWFVQREGQSAVFEVTWPSVQPLLGTFDTLLDRRLLQFPKADIRELQFEGDANRFAMRLDGGGWTIADWEDGAWGDASIADASLIADFLDRLSQVTLTEPRWGDDAPEFASRGTLTIATTEDRVEVHLGVEPSYVQRASEDVVFTGEPWLLERLEAPNATWRSLQLLRVDEVRVRGLVLERDGVTKRWERSDRGIWSREGETDEDREVLKVLDGLLFLRGKGTLPPNTGPLARVIEGRFVLDDGTEVPFRVGLAKDDRGVLREAGEAGDVRALLGVQGMHPRLAGLLAD